MTNQRELIEMANISNLTNLNSTTISTPQPPADVDTWRNGFYVFLKIALLVIVVVALFCNLVVVYAFIVYKKLRISVTNYFVISLAVSDILTSGLYTAFKFDQVLRHYRWVHGEFMCSLYTTMYLLAVPSSVMNLCAVTVDRYLVLRMPLRYHTLMPPWRALLTICCLWIYAITWACLPVMGWNVGLPVIHNGYCFFVTTREYNAIVNVVNFLLPMLFMAIFWCLIYTIVYQHHKRVLKIERSLSLNTNDSSNSSNVEATQMSSLTSARTERKEKKKMRRNIRGSRYIGFIVVFFYFCWLPFVTVSMIGNFCESCDKEGQIPFEVYEAFLVLGLMNSALNPFFYPFHDKHFKEAFRDMWMKMRSKTFLKLLRREGEAV